MLHVAGGDHCPWVGTAPMGECHRIGRASRHPYGRAALSHATTWPEGGDPPVGVVPKSSLQAILAGGVHSNKRPGRIWSPL
ncbi:hypothetical protein B296_00046775 [Ensete ventricosum]|uniref:Uncharacterized protein n=1 Tax=Ensete ventricosum TaxID=4639 RepID=A0A426Y0N4_ENSVE|nr:hypothetical protein B296_00046775 [Ensete ventricosum]